MKKITLAALLLVCAWPRFARSADDESVAHAHAFESVQPLTECMPDFETCAVLIYMMPKGDGHSKCYAKLPFHTTHASGKVK